MSSGSAARDLLRSSILILEAEERETVWPSATFIEASCRDTRETGREADGRREDEQARRRVDQKAAMETSATGRALGDKRRVSGATIDTSGREQKEADVDLRERLQLNNDALLGAWP